MTTGADVASLIEAKDDWGPASCYRKRWRRPTCTDHRTARSLYLPPHRILGTHHPRGI